jgi:uncharacterized protein (DUF58 family)
VTAARRRPRLPAGGSVLTTRGRGLLAAAAGLLAAARLFGSVELAGLGAAAFSAVAMAAVVVGRAPATYRGERWLAPSRVGAGAPASSRLRFTNVGPRPTGAAVAREFHLPPPRAIGESRFGRCVVPPLAPGAMAEAAYDLPTERRGVLTVGPLVLRLGDPLGLAERCTELVGPGRLVVHPRIRPVLALPGSSTHQARHGAVHPARAARGDDFFALREYEVGDDLRRVHWRSTARLGDLMLRQDEVRFSQVATVLLDTRAGAHQGDSFERALSVAASVAAALVEDGRRLRFVTTGGFEAAFDEGRPGAPVGHLQQRWATVLEHLALVTPDSGGPAAFALAVESIRRHPGGPLAAVVADASPAELAALGALRSRLGLVLIARCEADGVPAAPSVAGAVVVPVQNADSFPGAWDQAVLGCGRREAARR